MLKGGKQGRKEREAHEAVYPGNSHKAEECLEERKENSDRTKATNVLVGLEPRGFLHVGFLVLKSEESQACHWGQWIV